MPYIVPWSVAEFFTAFNVWNANCGPGTLAFALQKHINDVRLLFPGFPATNYTNPTMMREALHKSGRLVDVIGPQQLNMGASERIDIIRIQIEGPWTEAGANNRKWAYQHTHWMAAWREGEVRKAFDVNSQIVTLDAWKKIYLPQIIKSAHSRASGGWYPTHIWRLLPNDS